MRRHRTLALTIATAVALALGHGSADAAPSDYSDPDYLAHEIDNMSRSSIEGTQVAQLLNLPYGQALAAAANESWLENAGEQVAALPQGRLYTGVGQLVPGGAVGDPQAYHDVEPVEVSFVSRTGAELQGHLFWDGQPGAHPGIVITDGSIQGMQQAYWWAARTLARSGYLVLTWDPQGQGDSEGFGHIPGRIGLQLDGFPSQQDANFIDGTVDALRFLLSTEAEPYLPGGWSHADGTAVQRQGQDTILWSNPLAAFLDATRVGLAGHSLGARAVSVVQQCSDEGTEWVNVAACGGRSYPIRTIVAWDGLSSNSIVPVVPAMDQSADGYFTNAVPEYTAPDPNSNLGAFSRWQQAGVDSYTFTVRGGTHIEWITVPYVLTSTTYGIRQVDYYTLAWFERYLQPDVGRRHIAFAALTTGPVPDGVTGGVDERAWRANFFSVRRLSAFAITDLDGSPVAALDLRAYAGLSPVGDWVGANADQPTERR